MSNRLGIKRPGTSDINRYRKTTTTTTKNHHARRGSGPPPQQSRQQQSRLYDDGDDDDDDSSDEEERRLSAEHGEAEDVDDDGSSAKRRKKQTDAQVLGEYDKMPIKKPRRKPLVLTPEHLVGPKGLCKIRETFPLRFNTTNQTKTLPRTRAAMAKFSRNLVQAYQSWSDDLLPGVPLEEVLWKLHTLNSKTQVKQHLQVMRHQVRDAHVERLFGLEKAEQMLSQLAQGLDEGYADDNNDNDQQDNDVSNDENEQAANDQEGTNQVDPSTATASVAAGNEDVATASNVADADAIMASADNPAGDDHPETPPTRVTPPTKRKNPHHALDDSSDSDDDELEFEDAPKPSSKGLDAVKKNKRRVLDDSDSEDDDDDDDAKKPQDSTDSATSNHKDTEDGTNSGSKANAPAVMLHEQGEDMNVDGEEESVSQGSPAEKSQLKDKDVGTPTPKHVTTETCKSKESTPVSKGLDDVKKNKCRVLEDSDSEDDDNNNDASKPQGSTDSAPSKDNDDQVDYANGEDMNLDGSVPQDSPAPNNQDKDKVMGSPSQNQLTTEPSKPNGTGDKEGKADSKAASPSSQVENLDDSADKAPDTARGDSPTAASEPSKEILSTQEAQVKDAFPVSPSADTPPKKANGTENCTTPESETATVMGSQAMTMSMMGSPTQDQDCNDGTSDTSNRTPAPDSPDTATVMPTPTQQSLEGPSPYRENTPFGIGVNTPN